MKLRMSSSFWVVAAATAATIATASASGLTFPGEADEVKSLPGWTGALPSKHYSGCVRFERDLNVLTASGGDVPLDR